MLSTLRTLTLLSSLLASFTTTSAHSWIHCTHYQAENEVTFDPTKCKGYPRQASKYLSKGFGANTDYQLEVPPNGACPFAYEAYSDDYPMATYTAGERVCLVWPAKNHVASRQNPGMPDGGSVVVGKVWNGKDPGSADGFTLSFADFGKSPLVEELAAIDYTYPRRGFQNCPDYEHNPDDATCSQCFDLPTAVPEGTYTFSWRWTFNPENNTATPYVTCWEANVKHGTTPTKPTNVLGRELPSSQRTAQVPWATGTAKMKRGRRGWFW
ncbi:hypothetical protein HDV00_007272 [Rhizophlyctis rosea]|nr:hypothetical protein HDV00_007272 [Rhizophlyctis rosea]